MNLSLCSLLYAAVLACQSGPVLHWKGDDGASPTTAADASGNGNTGTYVNGASTSAVVPALQFSNASSFQFDGSNDRVDATAFSWPVGGPVTVAFWNFVATAEITTSTAFNVGNLSDLDRLQAHAPWSDHFLYWDYGDRAGGAGRLITLYDAYLDKWTHVTLVSEGVGGFFKAIYLDGVLVAAAPVSDGPSVPLTGAYLGAWPMNGNYHRGKIDDFRIYNRVLTAFQVQLLAAGHTEPTSAPTLTATSGAGNIQLSWTAVVGAPSAVVKRSLAPGGPYTPIANVASATAYLDSAVTSGTNYYYVVSAVGINEGPNSSEASAVPSPLPPPPPPVENILLKGCGATGLEAFVFLALLRAPARRRAPAHG